MICATCKAEGKKSMVYPGGAYSTAMGAHRYYDENGDWHSHDPNITTQGFSCSNGHTWTEKKKRKCWCEQEAASEPPVSAANGSNPPPSSSPGPSPQEQA